ncbi:mono/diheme cytochrome c family protein [Evansella vedderi]|uniref:Mono/diheme cytochrome c family protein n=1 Tax=Evansella vedderi TaxID=38282 RepID=A0ABT9ZT09_9BACI|nr:cytochrome c [Evansella vedderi]MDQ0254373.1 mono/diheme cytochrome c family protein [Evansella vedderi]
MKGKPLFPFAVTAVLGILLIVILSFVGLNQGQDIAGEDGDADEQEFETAYELGEHIYLQSCAACHGQDLEGVGSNPAVNALEGRFTKEEIVQIIHEGPGAMPPFANLGDDAEAVAEFLLTESE